MIKLKKILTEIISNTNLGQDIHFLVENKDRLYGDSKQILLHLIKIECIRDKQLQEKWINDIGVFIDNIVGNPSFHPKKSSINNLLKSPNKKPIKTWFNQARNKYNKEKQINKVPFPLFSSLKNSQMDKIKSSFNSIIESITKEGYLDYSDKVKYDIKQWFPIKNNG